jgi:hypothetical protein
MRIHLLFVRLDGCVFSTQFLSSAEQMKTVVHPYQFRGPFGLYYEKVLQPALEKSVGEPLMKTSDEMDMMDFEGDTCFVEVKTRSDQYHYSQEFIKKDGWLLPSCKIARAREEAKKGKTVVFFYFWKAGKSLWRWDFSEESFLDCNEKYPEWHHDQQKQAYIKEQNWTRVF